MIGFLMALAGAAASPTAVPVAQGNDVQVSIVRLDRRAARTWTAANSRDKIGYVVSSMRANPDMVVATQTVTPDEQGVRIGGGGGVELATGITVVNGESTYNRSQIPLETWDGVVRLKGRDAVEIDVHQRHIDGWSKASGVRLPFVVDASAKGMVLPMRRPNVIQISRSGDDRHGRVFVVYVGPPLAPHPEHSPIILRRAVPTMVSDPQAPIGFSTTLASAEKK